VTCRVGEHIQRLLGIAGAVESQLGAEPQGRVLVSFERVDVLDDVVDVRLLRHFVLGPRRARELLDLLERELPRPIGPGEDQPVRGVRAGVGRGLVTGAVDQPQELAVELGQLAWSLAVQNCVQSCRHPCG